MPADATGARDPGAAAPDAEQARARLLVKRLAASLQAELVETHISWVLLGATEAFKIKKPLRTAFLDYGSLAARRHCCEEELRLNARLAPGLYLDVVAIAGTPEAPRIDPAAPAIEYAVRMRRFPASALLSVRLQSGRLTPAQVDAMADLLARFHAGAPTATGGNDFGSPARRAAAALDALAGAAPAARGAERRRLQDWLQQEAERLAPCWQERQAGGQVRECHGDLHLDNLLWLDGAPAAFDGVEFNPALRWIDTLDDIAFPVMDFEARGRADLAFRLLNRWLDGTGDHAGLPGLRYSVVYRALVRAQVAALRGPAGRLARARYFDAALRWRGGAALGSPPMLTIMHGLPGSGKTQRSQAMLERQGAIRIRSDVERKRLFGLGMLDDSRAAGMSIYTVEAGQRAYEQVLARAERALGAGFAVILDAAFLRRGERDQAHALARRLGVPFAIAPCEAPLPVLKARLDARRGDASEADRRVLALLASTAQPLASDEAPFVLADEAGPATPA